MKLKIDDFNTFYLIHSLKLLHSACIFDINKKIFGSLYNLVISAAHYI